nr:pilin [Nitrococcus mobilis]
MTEAFSLASGQKTNVAEIWTSEGSFNSADNGKFGIPTNTTINGKYVNKVDVLNGKITATMQTAGVSSGISGKTLSLSPQTHSGSIEWKCSSNAAQKYIPKNCTGT